MTDQGQPERLSEADAPDAESPREPIEGWLLVFCIIYAIIVPLNLLRSIVAIRESYWTVTYIVLAILTMVAGIATWVRATSAFTFIRLAFIAWLIYAALQLHFAIQLQHFPTTSKFAGKEYLGAARSTVHVILWFWYLKVSIRVEQTFGRNI